jgi:NADPH-dependent curcumin reductase
MTRLIRLRRRPAGVPEPDDIELVEAPEPTLADGEVLVAPETISLDPYIRLRMAGRHLVGNLTPGDPISSEMVGRVVESRSAGFRPGDIVAGFSPWTDLAALPAEELRHIDFGALPASLALGVLGMPGLTAYAGVTRCLEIGADDVLVVSAAAGPVGATVGQLAKARGARVIGIAGGPEKARWVTDAAGFDACIDYRAEDVSDALARVAPDKPTAYFDNVGGALLRTMIRALRPYGRVALCGIIADYNASEPEPGPLPLEIISARATVRGLVVYDHEDLRAAMIAEHRALIESGRLAWREDVTIGLDQAPAGFARLMRGDNQGKAVVRLSQGERT